MTLPKFGAPVPDFVPPPRPEPGNGPGAGRFVGLEPLDPARHATDVHSANLASDAMWDYLPYGPFPTQRDWTVWAEPAAASRDPLFFALRDLGTGRASGVASYLRVLPEAGSIEVGHIALAPELQRTPAATEAMALMMRWAFAAGYRRYEWKCDALNLPSRRAAERLGFVFEGVFRQAAVVKGRNRDTAWFAVIDKDWPTLADAFDAWLAPGNFDSSGRQRQSLAAYRREKTQP